MIGKFFSKRRIVSVFEDIKKDYCAIANEKSVEKPIAWVNGQAKSGTTLVENIVSYAGYVDGLRSPFRRYYRCPNYTAGAVCNKLFDGFPRNKRTFLKTHTPYSNELDALLRDNGIATILICRDLTDTLISRYHHVLSSPGHWQYASLNKNRSVNLKENFKRSIFNINPLTGISSLEYFSKWLDSWNTSEYQENIFWFEDYKKDPISWIRAILDLIDAENISPEWVEEQIDNTRKQMLNTTESLSIRREKFGPLSGTFRTIERTNKCDYIDRDVEEAISIMGEKYCIGRQK